MVRRWVVVAALGLVGCESLKNSQPPAVEPPPVSQRTEAASPERGASAPRAPTNTGGSRPPLGEATTTPQPPPPPAEDPAADPLTLAAECLARNDRTGAAVHLESHVRAHPDQIMFRAQLAELLAAARKDADAKFHFERFADDARAAAGPPRDHLVHVHTRLMEIAARGGDRFGEAYHRGVGLLLLVKEQDGAADRDADFCEEMLCKAMKALADAKELKPDEPRVRAYLAEVYERAGNHRGAEAERAAAGKSVTPSGLTPRITASAGSGTR